MWVFPYCDVATRRTTAEMTGKYRLLYTIKNLLNKS